MKMPSEEEQLTMVVKNLFLVYHKYLFAQYFPNFKALIAARTQIEATINNGTIKNEDPPRFKKNVGSSSKIVEVSNICINDPYQLIAPIASMPISQGPPPRPRREFHECWYHILSALGLRAEPQKIQKYQFLSMGPWERQERRGITRLDTGAPKVHFLVKMTKMPLVCPRVDQRSNEVQTPTKQHFSQFYFKLEILEDFKLFSLVWPKFNPG